MAEPRRLLIIGNGPSTAPLAERGFQQLRSDMDTFGMGAAYRHYEQIGWWPTFYALGDRKVAFSHRAALRRVIEDPAVPTKRFFASWPLSQADRFELIDHSSTGDFCLKQALELGYREIYLLGVEGSYQERISESRELSDAEHETLGFAALGLSEADRRSLRIITRTPEENPNYFFSAYQQQGDVYSLPRSDAHRRRWSEAAALVDASDAKIINLSPSSQVLDFPRSSDSSCLYRDGAPPPDCTFGPFPRERRERLDEADIAFDLLHDREAPHRGVMIDVGACKGRAFRAFAAAGWTVHAFEPNPPLFATLREDYQDAGVTISNAAVSDVEGEALPFYTSDESLGISSLKPFRDSHEVTATVSTVTLTGYFRDHGIDQVDFLKVDTEGFDLMVLKGADLERHGPGVIVCEFEDRKTKPLGYTTSDLADYLCSFGYAVYVSEWHPVQRYGGPHEWRALKRYPCALEDAEAWGNLIAFKADPGFWAVTRAVRKSMTQHRNRDGVPTAAHRPIYAGIGEALKARSPRAFQLARFARRALAALWRRRRWTGPALLLLVGTAMLGFAPPLAEHRLLVWGGTAFAAAFGALAYLALRLQLLTEASAARSAEQARAAQLLREQLTTQKKRLERQSKRLEAQRGQLETQSRQLETQRKQLETQSKQLERQSNQLGELQKLQAATRATTKTNQLALRDLRRDNVSHHQRIEERIAAGERQLGLLRYPDAPACIVLFGHHKCGSRFFRNEIFERIAQMLDARVRRYEIAEPPFHYTRGEDLDLKNMDLTGLGRDGTDVVLFGNATQQSLRAICEGTSSWKGLRVIRDPRQVLVSSYFHHRGDHVSEGPQGWVWDQLAQDKPVLRELPEEEGLLYELDHITRDTLETQLLPPFDDERVLTVRLEDFADDSRRELRRIAEFLEVPDIAGIDLSRTSANEESGDWRAHFTPRLRQLFKERYGEALVALGYAEDLDW